MEKKDVLLRLIKAKKLIVLVAVRAISIAIWRAGIPVHSSSAAAAALVEVLLSIGFRARNTLVASFATIDRLRFRSATILVWSETQEGRIVVSRRHLLGINDTLQSYPQTDLDAKVTTRKENGDL